MIENDVSIEDDTLAYWSWTLRILAEFAQDTDSKLVDIKLHETEDKEISGGKVTWNKGLGS